MFNCKYSILYFKNIVNYVRHKIINIFRKLLKLGTYDTIMLTKFFVITYLYG